MAIYGDYVKIVLVIISGIIKKNITYLARGPLFIDWKVGNDGDPDVFAAAAGHHPVTVFLIRSISFYCLEHDFHKKYDFDLIGFSIYLIGMYTFCCVLLCEQ